MRKPLSLLLVSATLLAAAAPGAGAQVAPEGAWLEDVAAHYASWGRVDDELRWAPWLCRMPFPSRARVSRAGTHDRKVYFVYASDRPVYVSLTHGGDGPPPRGFTVVKEAFHPRVLEAEAADGMGYHPMPRGAAPAEDPPPLPTHARGDVYSPTRDAEGRPVGAGEYGGIYVLRYLGEGVPGTDAGWIYGTVTPDGEVSSTGVVERCAGCHRRAPHGRLFGLGA